MLFNRIQKIENNIISKRILVVYGPRRVGKTTSLQLYLKTQKDKRVYFGSGEDLLVRGIFKDQDKSAIVDFASNYDVIVIDEAQEIPNIGMGAKMLIDACPDKNIILSGSSSFSLAQEVGEPLTGRHFTMELHPISQKEISLSKIELKHNLENFLIYGSYPEIVLTESTKQKEKILTELISSYLFKDILVLDKIRSTDLLLDILRCLAFQIGGEVSYTEIANTVNSNVKTVQRYIDVLEKMFVIKKVRVYSTNLRSEISQKSKFYFLDNGVRNACIKSFNGLENRNDVGQLFENFIFMELWKKNIIEEKNQSFYFWKTKNDKELDIVIETNGELTGYECKWNTNTKHGSKMWKELYPQARYEVINKDNYLDFLM